MVFQRAHCWRLPSSKRTTEAPGVKIWKKPHTKTIFSTSRAPHSGLQGSSFDFFQHSKIRIHRINCDVLGVVGLTAARTTGGSGETLPMTHLLECTGSAVGICARSSRWLGGPHRPQRSLTFRNSSESKKANVNTSFACRTVKLVT